MVKLLEFSTKKIARQEAQAETECLKASYFLWRALALWVLHLLLILLEGDANIPVTTTDTLIDCDQTCLISYHSLVLAVTPPPAGGVLLVRLPAGEDNERDKKDVGDNEHNVHGSPFREAFAQS